VEAARAGSKLVEKASLAMAQITQSVQEVVGFIDSIALSSNEQRAGIESVNYSMGQIDQMTRQNAAMVEQSAAATMKMRDQATPFDRPWTFLKPPDFLQEWRNRSTPTQSITRIAATPHLLFELTYVSIQLDTPIQST
jgi:methyl-accepting chemotaxis protein